MKIAQKFAAVSALSLGFAVSAMAAVPESVSTGLADAKADALTVGGLVIGIIIAIAGFKYIKRAMGG